MKTFLPAIIVIAFAFVSSSFAEKIAHPYSGFCLYTTDFEEVVNSKIGQVSGATAKEAQDACANAVRKELGMMGEKKKNVIPAMDLDSHLEIDAIRELTDAGKIITIIAPEPAKKI